MYKIKLINLIYIFIFILLSGCANRATFTIKTESMFSPSYALTKQDPIFITNNKNINSDNLLYKNIKPKIEDIFKNLGYTIVNNIQQAKYIVAINYIVQPIDKVGGGAIPQFETTYTTNNHIVGGGTRNNFFLHGYTTQTPHTNITGYQTYTYHYTEYANIVGFDIYDIVINKKKVNLENAGVAISGWTSSSESLLQNMNLASMVLRDLLIAKPNAPRQYTFIWEDKILKSFTWAPRQ